MNRIRLLFVSILIAMMGMLHTGATAQVVQEREEGEANPAAAIFRATLYGAGTGLVLGGAFALIEEDDDISTWDSLQWGLAGGAAAGALIGLVYVITRPEPQGDVEELDTDDDTGRLSPQITVPAVLLTQEQDVLGNRYSEVEVKLVNMTF